MKMVIDGISVELNFQNLEIAKEKEFPIMIDDENDDGGCLELSILQAKMIREYLGYMIERLEEE